MRVEREVAAPAADVWAVTTDLDRAAEVISGIEALERVDGEDGFRIGTRWRETRTMLGRTVTEEMEVTALDPGRSYTVEADSAGARFRSMVGVEPTGERSSRLWMTVDAQPAGLVGKVLAATIGRLFRGATRKALQADLDDIAAAAERHQQP